MKKIFYSLLIILLFSLTAQADTNSYIAGTSVSAVSACTTIADDQGSGSLSASPFGNATVYKRGTEWITGSSGYNLCKFDIWLKKTQSGTLNGTVTVMVTAASGGSPSTILATAVETKTQANLTTSCAQYTFTLSSPVALSGSTAYYITVESDTLNDTNNYFEICYLNSGSDDIDYYVSSWATASSSTTARLITYK